MDLLSEDVSYFGRPFSEEPRVALKEASFKGSESSQSDEVEYVPSFHDLVTIWRQRLASASRVKQTLQFPSLYEQSQALDSSAEIGRGASFVAYKRAIPAHVPQERKVDMGGWTVSTTPAKQNRPDFVVYKTARITFDQNGHVPPSYVPAMRSVLMEMYVLSHSPILEHPNIIQFLGLAWATDSMNPNMRIPAIVVEHARHGSLAQVLASTYHNYDVLLKVCAGIAEGLNLLHKCGIVHGDLKAENVLVCPDETGNGYVPKLADFGFSFVGHEASASVRIGGTRPWHAPEAKEPILRSMLSATDVYSLGLLIWKTLVHVSNPFTLILDEPNEQGNTNEYLQTIENLKSQPNFHEQVHISNWFGKDLLLLIAKAGRSVPDAVASIGARLTSLVNAIAGTAGPAQDLDQLHRNKLLTTTLGPMAARVLPWAQSFDKMMDSCLQLNPSDRDLSTVVEILRTQSAAVPPQSELKEEEMMLQQGYQNHSLSWESFNMLSPDLQKVVAECLYAEYKSNLSQRRINPLHAFVLAALCVNGHGIKEDYELARELITTCANNELKIAEAYCWRLFQGMDPDRNPPFNYAWTVGKCASIGARLALEDLHEIEPETAKDFRHKNQIYKARIGSKFFYSSQLLNGNSIEGYLNLFDNPDELVSKLKALSDVTKVKVNKRGDKVLHVAAACGKPGAISALLREFPDAITVNDLNEQGETPLLCACRSGHTSATKRLLELGADASIPTQRNESPLHWLVSFTREEVSEIFTLLLASGAKADLLSTAVIAYSDFPAGLDVDHKTPGSALLWAATENREDIVKLFMADESNLGLPTLAFGNYRSPIAQAAHLHHSECFHVMLDAIKSRNSIYNQLLRHVVSGANKFSMMTRHGKRWRAALEATLRPLLAVPVASIGDGSGSSILSYAVQLQHPEVVQILLSEGLAATEEREKKRTENPDEDKYTTQVNEAARPGFVRSEHITQPSGENKTTPLLEAVRTGQISVYNMLVEHGADPRDVSQNPFSRDEMTWTALHINSHAKSYAASSFVDILLSANVPVDGLTNEQGQVAGETPVMVAIMNDSFELASKLMENGADVNAVSTSCGFIRLDLPTTILGHIAVSAARNSTSRLRYLLYQSPSSSKVDFIVEPGSRFTALHRAAAGPSNMFERGPDVTGDRLVEWPAYDWAANREILYELLQKWDLPEEINAKGGAAGVTALMLAARSRNAGAVEMLLSKGASADLTDDNGKSAIDYLKASTVPSHNIPATQAGDRISHLLQSSQAVRDLRQLEELDLN